MSFNYIWQVEHKILVEAGQLWGGGGGGVESEFPGSRNLYSRFPPPSLVLPSLIPSPIDFPPPLLPGSRPPVPPDQLALFTS